jgi:hypothetical protein
MVSTWSGVTTCGIGAEKNEEGKTCTWWGRVLKEAEPAILTEGEREEDWGGVRLGKRLREGGSVVRRTRLKVSGTNTVEDVTMGAPSTLAVVG